MHAHAQCSCASPRFFSLMPVTLSVPAQGEPMAREIIVYS